MDYSWPTRVRLGSFRRHGMCRLPRGSKGNFGAAKQARQRPHPRTLVSSDCHPYHSRVTTRLVEHSGRFQSIHATQRWQTRGAGFHGRYALRIGDQDLELWIESGLEHAITPLVGTTVSLFVLYDDLISVRSGDQAFTTYAETWIAWIGVIVLVPLASAFFWSGFTDPVAFLPLLLFVYILRMLWRLLAVGRAAARFPDAVPPIRIEHTGI